MKKTAITMLLALSLCGAAWANSTPPTWRSDVPALDADYVIGIEDVLHISVWGEAELERSVFVRPDGKVTFPLVNDIRVAGLTPDEVRADVTKRLAQFIREPNVTVIVEQINSFRIFVLGEVGSQGALNFNRPTRLLQAISRAGGFGEFSKREVVVLRQTEQGETRITVNYKKLIAGDPAEENLYLQPGDTLLVN